MKVLTGVVSLAPKKKLEPDPVTRGHSRVRYVSTLLKPPLKVEVLVALTVFGVDKLLSTPIQPLTGKIDHPEGVLTVLVVAAGVNPCAQKLKFAINECVTMYFSLFVLSSSGFPMIWLQLIEFQPYNCCNVVELKVKISACNVLRTSVPCHSSSPFKVSLSLGNIKQDLGAV